MRQYLLAIPLVLLTTGAAYAFRHQAFSIDGPGVSGGVSHTFGNSSATRYNGVPYVFYADTTDGSLRYSRFDLSTNTWTHGVLDGAGTGGRVSTLSGSTKVGQLGQWITAGQYSTQIDVYYLGNWSGHSTVGFRHAYSWDGTNWSFETLDGASTGSCTTAASPSSDLTTQWNGLGSGRIDNFFFSSAQDLRHVWYDGGGTWRCETLDGDANTGGRTTASLDGEISSTKHTDTSGVQSIQVLYSDTGGTVRRSWTTSATQPWSYESLPYSRIPQGLAITSFRNNLFATYLPNDEMFRSFAVQKLTPTGWSLYLSEAQEPTYERISTRADDACFTIVYTSQNSGGPVRIDDCTGAGFDRYQNIGTPDDGTYPWAPRVGNTSPELTTTWGNPHTGRLEVYSDCGVSFGTGFWPGSCWFPFSANSDFKHDSRADSVASNSAAVITKILSTPGAHPFRLVVDASGMMGEPTYYAKSTDNVYAVTCDASRCPAGYCPSGTIRIPAGVVAEQPSFVDDSGNVITCSTTTSPRCASANRPTWAPNPATDSDPDFHMTIVDQAAGKAISLYQANSISSTNGVIAACGGVSTFTGNGARSGAGNGAPTTAAGFSNIAGRIRIEELEDERIDHALMMVVNCTNGTKALPAWNATGRVCANTTNAPAMGAHIRLDMTFDAIEALAVPRYEKTILKALSKYGAYIEDTGGTINFETESGSQYLAAPKTDRWWQFAQTNGWSLWTTSNSNYDQYNTDLHLSLWQDHLVVLQPPL